MKKNIKVLDDKNRVIDPWEDYINQGYENLSSFQKIFRPLLIILLEIQQLQIVMVIIQ